MCEAWTWMTSVRPNKWLFQCQRLCDGHSYSAHLFEDIDIWRIVRTDCDAGRLAPKIETSDMGHYCLSRSEITHEACLPGRHIEWWQWSNFKIRVNNNGYGLPLSMVSSMKSPQISLGHCSPSLHQKPEALRDGNVSLSSLHVANILHN